MPGDLEVIGQRSDGNESTIVDLRWSPPEDTGGVTLDHYTLTITSLSPPPLVLPLTILTNDTTYTVTLPSNMTYNMAVTASNCAGTSLGRSELLNLSFSKAVKTAANFHFDSIAQGMHELLLLGRAFSLHGARATGRCLFSAWSSSHWDVPFLCMELEPSFLCMELEPLGCAFSLHGAQATGTCLFSAWSSSHWDVPFSETYAR